MKKSLWLVGLVLLVSWSCKRDYDDKGFVGTPYISASENFQVTAPFSISETGSVDFPLGINQDFSATFNETVSWEILIEGLTSGATYTIKGTSSTINETWTGRHDGVFFFEGQEMVRSTLKIIGSNQTFSNQFSIANGGQRSYKTGNPNLVFVDFTDFEIGFLGGFPNQFKLDNSGTVFEAPVLQDEDYQAPEGRYFGRVLGRSVAQNGFFVGGLQHRKPSLNTYYINWTDPNQIYVNLFVRGVENPLPNTRPVAVLNFEFHEDDDGTNICGGVPNTFDMHCPQNEDGWVFKIPISHSGWKLFSTKYSNLTPGEDAANGGSGNRVLQPDRIFRVQMGVVSNPPFNTVQADFDFACFTLGAPFDPKTF